MPTKKRLVVSNILWTFLIIILGLGAAFARTSGYSAPAEVEVALYIMVAFPSGLGWYDLSIGKYQGGPAELRAFSLEE